MNVGIKTLPERRIAAVHHRGPYETIAQAFARLDAIARPAGLFERAGVEMVAVYYDDPRTTPAAELRAEAGLVVPPDLELPEGLEEVELPAGRYARTLYEGAYSGLGECWAWLRETVRAHDELRIGSGPMYERYQNTPETVAPAELRTELYLPLAH